jgi:hypothetical protein
MTPSCRVKVVVWLEGEGKGCQIEEEREEAEKTRGRGDSGGLNSHQGPDRLHVLVCLTSCCWRSEVGSSEAGQIALVVRTRPWAGRGQGSLGRVQRS